MTMVDVNKTKETKSIFEYMSDFSNSATAETK